MIHIDGPLDTAVLERCLGEIVRRHEAWRTVFPAIDGEPFQLILPPGPFALDVADLSGLPSAELESQVLHRAVEHARKVFHLATGPLVRALLIRTSAVESRLVVTAHHIVVDGVSFFSVFLPELAALLSAFSRGQPSPLREPQLQYVDFAQWQRDWLSEKALAPRLAYWQEQLRDLTLPALPTDSPPPQSVDEAGARVPLALSTELTASLRELARRNGVTLFTLLLAAWKTLLFRYSGQGDIVVGSAAAGRPRPELAELIGFFNNNLVLRTQLDGAATFLELLPKVAEVLRAAREHQDVPFDRLIALQKGARRHSPSPLFNNVFILMPPLPALDGEPQLRASRFDIGVAKVELYLELHQRSVGLVGHLEYQTSLFKRSTIERMAGHFLTLVQSIASDPAQRLSELPLMTQAEQQQISIWQGPSRVVPESEFQSLEALFSAQVRRSPQAIAVEHGDKRLTYAELDLRATRLAHALRARGVGPEVLVGLGIERSVEAMIGILAILKAGGAYVPLDPAYPRERLRYIVEDAGLRIVLASPRTAEVMREHPSCDVLVIQSGESGEATAQEPLPRTTAVNLAYVIYTSGSTGHPKGVMVERRGLYHLAQAQAQRFELGVGSRVLQFFSINFDGSVWDFTLTWPVGATLVLADREELVPGKGLVEFLRRKEISAVMVTPSALAVMPKAELPALRVLITGAEVLTEELVARWAAGRRFFNAYGPTEATIAATLAECRAGEGKPTIGRPFEYASVHILDANLRPVPVGIAGELYIGGPGLARGYLNRPELSAERFVEVSLDATVARLYKTGDRGRWQADGSIEFLGRTDHQIKLRGLRIELEEIEAELGRHPAVAQAAVKLVQLGEEQRLVGYFVPLGDAPKELESGLIRHLRARLPEYMVPATFVSLERMPRSPNGKLDRAALPLPRVQAQPRAQAQKIPALEQTVAAIWQEVLGIPEVALDAPFFEVGGHSLALARVQAKLQSRLGVEVDILTLLRLPTIQQLAEHLLRTVPGLKPPAPPSSPEDPGASRESASRSAATSAQHLAIVGMAIRAPGIQGAAELWEVTRTGRTTISSLDPEALIAAGADPARVRRPDFVPAEGVLEEADRFDAGFFGYSDADATFMDPQQRLFLECAYEALESAGYDASRYQQRIGVFGGSGAPLYWLGPVMNAIRASGSEMDALRARMLNSPDFLALRVAFKLGLRGPAVTIQTACSTSLSAVHMARQSLLAGECDLALAGGVTLTSLREAERGYFHDAEGGHESADGHCRPFDVRASGMVRSSGVALVALKRLADAVRDGDTIHAVIIGSAMANDGASKIGFTAPSEEGIADAIQRAYEAAGVDPRSVGFVEAHGTGTRLGDPIEVRALTRAFHKWTEARGFCALGSVKANLGHVDSAAGVTGLIKATLAIENGIIPPVAGFTAANPLLSLPSTPFFVPDAPLAWPASGQPRRASINAIGIGGTNVHVVLEEFPAVDSARPARPAQVLCLSAKSESALAKVKRRLDEHLAKHPASALADVAFTLAVGRAQHRYRTTVVCAEIAQARAALAAETRPVLAPSASAKPARSVVFLFPGHGAHYPKMGVALYEAEPVFRAEVDRCIDIVSRDAGLDLRRFWQSEAAAGPQTADEIPLTQALLFTIEYALARQFLAWGVRPTAMLGHSLGEYVAACIGGVFALREALALVVARSRLAETTALGSMLVVFADAQTVAPHLDAETTIATYAPGSVVLTGLVASVEGTAARLKSAGIETAPVRATRAGHSPVMRDIHSALRRRIAEVELRPSAIPIISNLTGAEMTPEQATSPDAWADHMCSPVRLEEGFGALLGLDSPICIELGPGSSLSNLLKRHDRFEGAKAQVLKTIPDSKKRTEPAYEALLRTVGQLWELGVELDWRAFYAHETRRRVPLPTYPFERQLFALGPLPAEPSASPAPPDSPAAPLDRRLLELTRELGVRGVDDCPGLRPRLEEVCASLVLDYVARRLAAEPEQSFSLAELQGRLGILPKFAPMLRYLVEVIERAGLASRSSAGRLRLRTEQAGRSAELMARLKHDIPGSEGLIRYAAHCVGSYDAVLSGASDPLSAIYPGGTNALFMECSHHLGLPHWHAYVALAREAVVDIVKRRRGRKTRILEVGAGHGTLTWPLAERLRETDIEYHFTDIGRTFLTRADAEITRRGLSWMHTLQFDLNRPPAEQRLAASYDIILGLDSVHVADDLAASLGNLHALLSPGGSLILIESTRSETWDQLAAGLLPGYWDIGHMRDGFWLDLKRWETYLRGAGFSTVTGVPGSARLREAAGYGLLIAERMGMAQAAPAVSQEEVAPDEDGGAAEGLWKRLLGSAPTSDAANFFELGGDSLLAVQLLAELRLKTGREIKMRQFAAQPTLGGLKELLRQTEEPAQPTLPIASQAPAAAPQAPAAPPAVSSLLVPLQPTGSKRPLFFVHPIGGTTLCYAQLARAIDPDRPFFGIQSPMIEDRATRPASIAELATRYIEALRQVQPDGPYLLGGWSFGGVIAVEMARQLQEGGQTVGRLVLLDAVAAPGAWLSILHRLSPRWAALSMLPWILNRSSAAPGPERDELSAFSDHLHVASQNLVLYGHHLAIWRQHTPAQLDVPAVHFVPEKGVLRRGLALPTGARPLPLPSMRTVHVSGDHFSMLAGAQAEDLGARIRGELDATDRAQAAARGATASPARDAGARERDEASIRLFLERYVGWMRTRDATSLGEMFADDCVNVSSGETILVGAALMKQHYNRKIPGLLDVRIIVHDWQIRVSADGSCAFAVGRVDSDQTFIAGKRRVSYRGTRVTLVLERQDGRWRIIHSHYSLPVGGALETLG